MNEIINKIVEKHKGDKEQLEVICSEEKRLLVEAPAGYGKTQTMTSKIAYLLATGKIPNPKKILALTFSVNAAQKIKKDILKDLPKLDDKFTVNYLNKRITATNYHGFARQILRRHGHIYSENLKKIDLFEVVEDKNEQTLSFYQNKLNLSEEEIRFIDNFNDAVNRVKRKFIGENMEKYKNLLLEKFIPNKHITYNGLLVLSFFILEENKNLLKFYRKLYPFIIIDEFQDTNILGFYLIWPFLKEEETSFLILGDPLQQIYGFIGSIPNIFDKLEKHYNFKKIKLKNNYRFKDKEYLLKIDKIIREHAKNFGNASIKDEDWTKLNIYSTFTQEEEAYKIIEIIESIQSKDENSNIAILFRVSKTNPNTKKILEILNQKNISYFYALFSEDDSDYRKFHLIALTYFISEFRNNPLNKTNWTKFLNILKNSNEIKKLKDRNLVNSLHYLMEIFYDKEIKIWKNKLSLPKEEIVSNISFIFAEKQLKQYLKYVEEKIIVVTVHGAKGLEWDYVIVPDMEKYGFPSYLGLCQYCKNINNSDCFLDLINSEEIDKLYQELSTFYVACTRAKKDLIFTKSEKRYNSKDNLSSAHISCFLKLEGFII